MVTRRNLPELQVAYDRVKAFPEDLPNESVLWLELRAAVEKVLQHYTG